MTHLLTCATFLPLIGALVLWWIPKERPAAIKTTALLASAGTFLLGLVPAVRFDVATAGIQFEERANWISLDTMRIGYHIGIDGISLWLLVLTAFLTPLAILSSWTAINQRIKFYYSLLLILETGILGVFVSLDLILFYVFWEVMLIPMYLLIGIWGGGQRIYAAVKFILYTMLGSLLMLVGILYLHRVCGSGGFDFVEIQAALRLQPNLLSFNEQLWLFLAFFLAFAIKVPLFPLHTWLPDAHVEAPTAGSVILAGVLLKMGTYGILRFCVPLFPQAVIDLAPYINILAIIGIIYGALVAMVQPDLKKLVAYSSVSHMGLVVLGIFVLNKQGMEGAIFQMLSHGLSTGALFFCVGMIYERRHTRLIVDFGGLAHRMPIFASFFLVITLSSIGLPLLNGFVGEFLILLGTYQAQRGLAALAATGMVLSAVYMLWMYQRTLLGPISIPDNQSLQDLNRRERWVLLPILAMILVMGLYTTPFLRRMDTAVDNLVQTIEGTRDYRTGYRVQR
ncbi:MAG: NADH-quinone oxidoreductase subunit M [Acidobacteria bacterium]|nr:NADH-quinone oxidoreductase subunit M [Acidobacteriota bacterium]MBI3655181.1 NADH-quinone oxidoreductase subunit M [Acidobacteriota bacterium]